MMMNHLAGLTWMANWLRETPVLGELVVLAVFSSKGDNDLVGGWVVWIWNVGDLPSLTGALGISDRVLISASAQLSSTFFL